MSYFSDLEFLDLGDVSKEDAEEINNILHPTRSIRSVVLPWVEDHVDWSQQSSYEGETVSECSEGGGDCYQTAAGGGGGPTQPQVAVAVPPPTSLHQVYPPPQQVVPAVQLSYHLPPHPSGYYPPPQHHQVFDGGRRRSKASPKRSGGGGGGVGSAGVGSVQSSAVPGVGGQASAGQSPGGTTSVAPPYPLAPYAYHHPLVSPHPSTQYTYVGTGMGPAQHAAGHPLLYSQIPVYPPPHPHLYPPYSPQQHVYSPGMHGGPPAAGPPTTGPHDRGPAPKTDEPPGGGGGGTMPPHAPPPVPTPPIHPQPNDIDVGMGGGSSSRPTPPQSQSQPPSHIQQDTHLPPAQPPLHRPTSATTPTTTADTDAKAAEQSQESGSSRVAVPVPVPVPAGTVSGAVQSKSLPPQNAIKTTSLPPSSAIKAKPAAVSTARKTTEDHQPAAAAAVSQLQEPPAQSPVQAVTTTPVTTTAPPPLSPATAPAGGAVPAVTSVQPQAGPAAPPSPPPPAPPVTSIPSKPTWAGLFKPTTSAPPPAHPPSVASLPPLHSQTPPLHNNSSPTVAESMLGGNKGPPKGLSKGPPPQNAVVLTPPPAHLVAPAVHHSSVPHHVGTGTLSSSSVQQHAHDHDSTVGNRSSVHKHQLHQPTTTATPPAQSVAANSQDPTLTRIAEALSEYELEHRAVVLTPRGLNNPSNYCYINATLQALLACAPFYNLIRTLAKIKPPSSTAAASTTAIDKSSSPTPVIDSMIQFVSEFSAVPAAGRLRRERSEKAQARREGGGVDPDLGVLPGAPFEPVYVYRMVHSSSTFLQLEDRQEDAEEFLTVLLNGLNDEMTELLKLKGQGLSNGELTTNGEPHPSPEMDNSDWKEVMNNKGMSRVTRRTEVGRTPLTDIFMGQMRSRVARSDPQLSTDNIQPFYSLHLDVENCSTLEEALDKMTSEKAVEGGRVDDKTYTSSYIDHLPVVLILHLKCFYYSHGRPTKISKSPDFPIDLKLEPKLLQLNKSKQFAKTTSYKLFAVVYHEGKEATKGHYLADVYHVGSSTWIRYDDAQVKAVSEQQVLSPKSPRVPYLLLYRRMDKTNRP